MIKINGKELILEYFPAGELKLNFEVEAGNSYFIKWYYEKEEEFLALYYIANHIRENYGKVDALVLLYVPNGRMDRVRNENVFTLKYFCNLINSLNFPEVIIMDPHSDVTPALLNNVTVWTNQHEVNKLIASLKPDVLFYPDLGAAKKYSSIYKYPYLVGNKKRNWETGKIEGLDIIGEPLQSGFSVLIIDDICSFGGTFYYSAKRLQEFGAREINLYVTHCENSVLYGKFDIGLPSFYKDEKLVIDGRVSLMSTGFIDHLYTTNSIFTGKDKRITII